MEKFKFSATPAGEMAMSLAIPLTDNGHVGRFYLRDSEEVNVFQQIHKHPRRLSNTTFPSTIEATNNLTDAIDVDVLILGTPTRAIGEFYADIQQVSDRKPPIVVLVAKGIQGTLCAAEILEQVDSTITKRLVVLSGPNFASEIVRRQPTATTIASTNTEVMARLQRMLNTRTFRVYTTDDVKGTSYAGAFKNVIAIASGILKGSSVDDTVRGTVIFRGIEEMARLGEAHGGKRATFFGLAGLGDVMATCNSSLSRNFQAGIDLAQGKRAKELFESKKTIEGIYTAQSVLELIEISKSDNQTYPIMLTVWSVLYDKLSAKEAVKRLTKAI